MSKKLHKTRAYRLFLDELAAYLAEAKQNICLTEIVNEKFCREAARNFHTLKGGAGFFGLSAVAEYSANLEAIFKKPLEQMVCEMDQARRYILELEQMKEDLPPPIKEEAENA